MTIFCTRSNHFLLNWFNIMIKVNIEIEIIKYFKNKTEYYLFIKNIPKCEYLK